MDAELGKFIEIFVMVFLPLAFAVLLIGNRLNGLDEEISKLKKRIDKLDEEIMELKNRIKKLENKKE